MANARLWSIALLVWLPAAAFADPPPASFAIAFDGDAAVWNPFDGFQACETLEGVTLCLDLDAVVCNGKGACAGDASFEFSGLLDGLLTGPFTAQAKCKATDDPTRPVCKAKIASCETTGTIEGLDASITRCNIKGLVASDGSFDGFGRARVCVEDPDGAFCGNVGGVFPYVVNPPANWMLMVDLADDGGSGFVASATDTLGFSYTGKAKYSDKSDETKLALKGDKGTSSAGAKVAVKALTFSGAAVTGGEAKLRVQGTQAAVALD